MLLSIISKAADRNEAYVKEARSSPPLLPPPHVPQQPSTQQTPVIAAPLWRLGGTGTAPAQPLRRAAARPPALQRKEEPLSPLLPPAQCPPVPLPAGGRPPPEARRHREADPLRPAPRRVPEGPQRRHHEPQVPPRRHLHRRHLPRGLRRLCRRPRRALVRAPLHRRAPVPRQRRQVHGHAQGAHGGGRLRRRRRRRVRHVQRAPRRLARGEQALGELGDRRDRLHRRDARRRPDDPPPQRLGLLRHHHGRPHPLGRHHHLDGRRRRLLGGPAQGPRGGLPRDALVQRGVGALLLRRQRAPPAHHPPRHEVLHPNLHQKLLQPRSEGHAHLGRRRRARAAWRRDAGGAGAGARQGVCDD